MNKAIRISVSVLMILCLAAAAAVSASALGELTEVNTEQRHILCTELSEQAKDYYHDDYSFDKLMTLSGARDVSTSYSATRNNELYSALHSLMADTHSYYTTYSGYKAGSLAYFWSSTDAAAGSGSYIMFYSDIDAADESVKLNREHIWPKSRASYGEKNGGSDLHHLRPSVDKINSAKSDHLFGNINGVYDSGVKPVEYNGTVYAYVQSENDLFECRDDVKGDVARILLYVYCRWEQPNLYTDMTENLPEPDSDSKSNSGKKVVESLDTLLSWCESDPVDTWEMRRNDLAEQVQGNRNVFIDCPALAWRMFGREAPADMPAPGSGGGSEPPERKLLGDADSDGDVTAADATLIRRVIIRIADTSAINVEAADINGDGIDVTDATMIQRYVTHIEVPYPIGEATVGSQ